MGLRRNRSEQDGIDVCDRLLPFVDRLSRELLEGEAAADAEEAAAMAAAAVAAADTDG